MVSRQWHINIHPHKLFATRQVIEFSGGGRGGIDFIKHILMIGAQGEIHRSCNRVNRTGCKITVFKPRIADNRIKTRLLVNLQQVTRTRQGIQLAAAVDCHSRPA